MAEAGAQFRPPDNMEFIDFIKREKRQKYCGFVQQVLILKVLFSVRIVVRLSIRTMFGTACLSQRA